MRAPPLAVAFRLYLRTFLRLDWYRRLAADPQAIPRRAAVLLAVGYLGRRRRSGGSDPDD